MASLMRFFPEDFFSAAAAVAVEATPVASVAPASAVEVRKWRRLIIELVLAVGIETATLLVQSATRIFHFNRATKTAGFIISTPNGFFNSSKSSSCDTMIFAPLAKAHARKISSLASRLRRLPNGKGLK